MKISSTLKNMPSSLGTLVSVATVVAIAWSGFAVHPVSGQQPTPYLDINSGIADNRAGSVQWDTTDPYTAPAPGNHAPPPRDIANPYVAWAPENYPVSPQAEPVFYFPEESPSDLIYSWSALARSYYVNDQRIEWTGQEATLGMEGILAGSVHRQTGQWTHGVTGEIFLNQPFERNVLVDTPTRQSFAANFDIEAVQIQQLYLSMQRGDFSIIVGKMTTPFGRTYFPLYLNDYSDAPFIRTESVFWRETGLLLQYEPGPWTFSAMLVNGSRDRDTNSSKGIVARVGYDTPWFALGASVKKHDGVGSEHQKIFSNHVGIDGMVRRGNWTLSGEAIYDQFGLRRDNFALTSITWGRSIYNRELNNVSGEPTTGFGFYANLGYENDCYSVMVNYGEFYPQELGDHIHDRVTRRWIFKGVRHFTENFDFYAMYLRENDVARAQEVRTRRGIDVLVGFQFEL